MNKFETKIVAGMTALVMTASFAGCDNLRAIGNQSTISNSELTPTEKPPSPTLNLTPIPTLEPEPPTPTLEPTLAPTPTEVPPTPTPEKEIVLSRVFYTGNPNKKEIAWTFDDNGPGLYTILNICNEKGIKVTFFLLAGELSANPAIWQQAIKDGHQICSHGAFHDMELGKKSEEEIRASVLGWEQVCKINLGEEYFNKMKTEFPYFRVPGGNYTDRFRKVLAELGYTTVVQWNAEDIWTMEAVNNPNNLTLAQNYLIRLTNGAIFLAHGGSAGSVVEVIDGAEAKGYSFKLVSEILD